MATRSTRRHGSPYMRSALIFGAAAVVLLLALVFALSLPWYPAWLIALGLVTFVAYGYDKRQAQHGGWRTPELLLHGLSLAGGFLGGWAGRAVFRHKTQHTSFLLVLIISTIIWVAIGFLLYVA